MLLQNYKIELCSNTRFVDLQQSLSIICLGTMIWVGLGENVSLTPSKPPGTVARERSDDDGDHNHDAHLLESPWEDGVEPSVGEGEGGEVGEGGQVPGTQGGHRRGGEVKVLEEKGE